MFRLIISIFLGCFLLGCDEESQTVHYKDVPAFNAKNPVGLYCQPDCSGCDFNADRCKQMVKSNLGSLCENSEDNNCYTTWIKYSQTCEYLCRPSDPHLVGQAELVNIMFNEDFSV